MGIEGGAVIGELQGRKILQRGWLGRWDARRQGGHEGRWDRVRSDGSGWWEILVGHVGRGGVGGVGVGIGLGAGALVFGGLEEVFRLLVVGRAVGLVAVIFTSC